MSDLEPVVEPRKKPSQARSARTVSLILDAASQVLRARGEDGFTTTAVAERAGFSIGTLYQYFPNRDALLVALADRDWHAVADIVRRSRLVGPPEGDEALRHLIRVLVSHYQRRIGARRQFALLTQARRIGSDLFPRQDIADIVAGLFAAHGSTRPPAVDRARAFVLCRAVSGVLRAAALDGSDLLGTPELEDALFALMRALLVVERRLDRQETAAPPTP